MFEHIYTLHISRESHVDSDGEAVKNELLMFL